MNQTGRDELDEQLKQLALIAAAPNDAGTAVSSGAASSVQF